MKIIIDIMEFLLKSFEAELINETPEILDFVKKEITILIDNIKERIDDDMDY